MRWGSRFSGGSGLVLAVSDGATAPALGAMVVFGLGFGLLFPSLGTTVSEVASNRRRGIAFGIFYAVYSPGRRPRVGVSGMVAGMAVDLGTPFFVSAAVALAALPAGGIHPSGTRRRTPALARHFGDPSSPRRIHLVDSATTAGDGPDVNSVATTDAAMLAANPGVPTIMSPDAARAAGRETQMDDTTVPATTPDTAPQ